MAALLAFGSPAVAQVDAGARADRQARGLIEERLRPDPRREIEQGRPVFGEDARQPAEEDEGPSFLIRSIETNPTEVLSPEAVRAIVGPYENRTLSVGDIRRLVDRIDAAYRAARFKAGFAIVPDQDLTTGVLHIVLVEPRVDQITASGLNRVRPDYIASRIPLHSGGLFDLNGLENSLNLMNRMSPGAMHVEALLQPGRAFGTTSLDVRVHEAAPFELVTVVDNYGSRETGRYRPVSVARFANPLGIDDLLQIGVSGAINDAGDPGSYSGFFSYSVPVSDLTRLNLSASISRSNIDDGAFAALDLTTRSDYLAGSLRRPFLSTERWLVAGEFGGEVSISQTKTGPLLINRRIREMFAQVDATYYGDDAGLQASLKLAGFDAKIADNAGASSDHFVALSGGLFGYRRVGRFEARLRGNWQWSPYDLLPASKQFALGGPYSVRGYQIDQFSGDSGFYLGVEGRVSLLDPGHADNRFVGALNLVGFADGGGVFPFRADGTTPRREDFATSIGLGLEASLFSDYLTVFAGLAQPLDKVHRALHGNDPRFLFQAALRVPFHGEQVAQ